MRCSGKIWNRRRINTHKDVSVTVKQGSDVPKADAIVYGAGPTLHADAAEKLSAFEPFVLGQGFRGKGREIFQTRYGTDTKYKQLQGGRRLVRKRREAS